MENTDEKPDNKTYTTWQEDPANWKAGLLYYNPKDKRLFPPKRYGGGWTVNFANRNSIIAFIILLGIILAGIYIWYKIDNSK
ncbi:MAG TPA: DUF5808 domain-containing protein [Bacteroidia bacterium]|jgi:uncharacterized membrane protein|nr:DUF5808 domain-containing protein [Bacteroidia bacterium]